MPCFAPRLAWYGHGRTRNGKQVVVFSKEKAVFPDQSFKVRCGGCLGCRLDRARDWGTRIESERKHHASSCMVTLTYDDVHLPPFGSLVKDHPRVFIHNLRQSLNRDRVEQGLEPIYVRYMGSAEYGEPKSGQRFGRPHYHIVIFGYGFESDRVEAGKTQSGFPQYRSGLLERLWDKGRARISDVDATVGDYVGRYILKKINGDLAEDHYSVVDTESGEVSELVREFQFQSTQPGIGKGFVDRFLPDLHDGLVVCKGRKRPLPRYFLRVIEKEDPEMFEHLKLQREAFAELRQSEYTQRRLDVRHELAKAAVKSKPRKVG